jgi:hypothetical protein
METKSKYLLKNSHIRLEISTIFFNFASEKINEKYI